MGCIYLFGGRSKEKRRPILIRIFMADLEEKNEENVDGKFYVDSQCIDCDLCRETAPENFKREEDEGYSFVYKQPGNKEEELFEEMEETEGGGVAKTSSTDFQCTVEVAAGSDVVFYYMVSAYY